MIRGGSASSRYVAPRRIHCALLLLHDFIIAGADAYISSKKLYISIYK